MLEPGVLGEVPLSMAVFWSPELGLNVSHAGIETVLNFNDGCALIFNTEKLN